MAILKRILVAGDPILDVYHIGRMSDDRFLVDKTITKLGGAANTYLNCANICSKTDIKVDYAWGTNKLHYPSLKRYVDISSGKEETILTTWDVKESEKTKLVDAFYSFSSNAVFTMLEEANNKVESHNTLVLSDYNKGGVNKIDEDSLSVFDQLQFNLIVVDSRYASLHSDFLTSKPACKILHATGDEWRKWDELLLFFDFIITTDGKNEVLVCTPNDGSSLDVLRILNVPDTHVIDPVGAGDTFTAAIAAYLTNSQNFDRPSVYDATQFAIEACQDVIKRKYVAIATKTLKGE